MPWNYMQVEIMPDDLAVRPLIGRGGLTREQARAEIQSLLDRAASIAPFLADHATAWRSGVQDDTVSAGLMTWTIYHHPTGQNPESAAMAWLEDFAETMRSTGLKVHIHKPTI